MESTIGATDQPLTLLIDQQRHPGRHLPLQDGPVSRMKPLE